MREKGKDDSRAKQVEGPNVIYVILRAQGHCKKILLEDTYCIMRYLRCHYKLMS